MTGQSVYVAALHNPEGYENPVLGVYDNRESAEMAADDPPLGMKCYRRTSVYEIEVESQYEIRGKELAKEIAQDNEDVKNGNVSSDEWLDERTPTGGGANE